jgi:adenine-specific DNA-methyltransferase
VKNVQAQFESISNLSSGHEYVICYSANADVRFPLLSHDIEGSQAGKWDTFWRGTDRPTLRYELFGKTPETGQWRWSKDRALVADGNYKKFLGDPENNLTLDDYFLEHHQSTNTELDFVRLNEDGVVQYYVPPRDYKLISDNWMDVSIKGNEIGFDTEKHLNLMTRIIKWMCGPEDIVVDFFAGSGTTGHAVMSINAKDDGHRRYVLTQFPEPIQIGKFKNIAEMTKERLRQSAAKIKEENPLFSGDTGFRVFKLASSNIRAWEPDAADLEGGLLKNAEHLVQGRSEQDVLYELLLKLGLDLCVPIEKKSIVGKAVYSVGGGVLFVCLAEGLTKDVIEPLSAGIVAWRKELSPAVDTRVVFKDSGFADDIAKTNMAAILNQNGISDVRSL